MQNCFCLRIYVFISPIIWFLLVDLPSQGLSILLAMVLKALGPHQYYDSDDEYAPTRAPLLRNAVHPPPYVAGDPFSGSRTDAYGKRINEKVKILSSSIMAWNKNAFHSTSRRICFVKLYVLMFF